MVAMADLARQDPAVVSTSDMAGRLRIPLPVLQIIMARRAAERVAIPFLSPHRAKLDRSSTLSRPPWSPNETIHVPLLDQAKHLLDLRPN